MNLTIAQAADIIGLSPATIRSYVHHSDDLLPPFEKDESGHITFNIDELFSWLRDRRVIMEHALETDEAAAYLGFASRSALTVAFKRTGWRVRAYKVGHKKYYFPTALDKWATLAGFDKGWRAPTRMNVREGYDGGSGA